MFPPYPVGKLKFGKYIHKYKSKYMNNELLELFGTFRTTVFLLLLLHENSVHYIVKGSTVSVG